MLACRGHQRVFINNVKACREGKKGSDIPFLPFSSSSSVLLQLSVEPCQRQQVDTVGQKSGWTGETQRHHRTVHRLFFFFNLKVKWNWEALAHIDTETGGWMGGQTGRGGVGGEVDDDDDSVLPGAQTSQERT